MSVQNTFEVKLSTRDRISKSKISLHKKNPFFSYLVEHLYFIEKEAVITMGVDEKSRCYYNAKFVDSLDSSVLDGVLTHEVMHLALRHPARGKDRRNITVNGTTLWNIAADISINHLLIENGFSLPNCGIIPRGGSVTVFGVTIDNIGDKATEEIYEELKAQLKSQAQQSGKGKGKGQGDDENTITVSGFGPNEGKGFDEHVWGEGSGAGESEEGKEGKEASGEGEEVPKGNVNWEKKIAEAYHHAKMIGKTPAGFEREMEDLHKHKLNWRAILRKTVSSKLPYDLTYRRPNKKYLWGDIYQPSFTGEKIKVVCSIDTSGSMSEKDLADIISELLGISRSFSQVEFRLLTHDTDVHDDILISYNQEQKLKRIKVHGGGGTSHVPLYKYVQDKRYGKETKLLISFTDGYSEFPDRKPEVDTLFILTGGHCARENMPKWGDTIFLE
jgi:predicted metal-dependent peptidase